MAKDIRIIFSGDHSRADASIKSLENSGKQAASILEREFNQLGIKSALSFDNQRKAATAAYDKIKSSGLATADEMKRADVAYKARIKEITQAQNGVTDSTMGMKAAWSGFAGILAAAGIGSFVSQMTSARVEIDKIRASLSTTFGNNSGEEFAFVAAEADRLGLALNSTALEYGRLSAASKGTILEGRVTKEIFVGITEAGTALGLSAEEMSGTLNAVQQMMSKGKVQAEELRGQLGERLPGAFKMAADAMGVTQEQLNKMLDNGEVLASDLLPKLAVALHEKFGKAAEEAAKNVQGQLNRLDTAWKTLQVTVSEELPIAETLGLATDAAKLLGKHLDTVAVGFTGMAVAAGTSAIITNIGAITAAVRALGTATALSTGGLSLLAGAAVVAGYEGGKALSEMFDDDLGKNLSDHAAASAKRMDDLTKESEQARKLVEYDAERIAAAKLKAAEAAKKLRDQQIIDIKKHNEKILDVEKKRIDKSLELETAHLQKLVNSYETAVKSMDSLLDARKVANDNFSSAKDSLAPAQGSNDPYLKRLNDLDALKTKEQEINDSWSLSAEEKARKLSELAIESTKYKDAVVIDGVEIISQLDAEASAEETIIRLKEESAQLLAVEEVKRSQAAESFATQMIDAQAKVTAFTTEIETLETVLDRLNNKEINIIFKAQNAAQVISAAGGSITGLETTSLPSTTFHAGTSYVPRSGLYPLARGEQILNRNEASAARAGSNQPVTIAPVFHISGVSASGAEKTARELARELEPELRKLAGRYRS